MRELGDRGDRQDRAGRPGHVRDRDQPRIRRDRGVEGGQRPGVVAVVAGVDDLELGDATIAQRVERPQSTTVFMSSRDDTPAAPPVQGERSGVHRIGGGVGQGDARDVRAEDRGDPGPRLAHPAEQLLEGRGWARPTSRSQVAISAMAAAVSAGSGPTDPVFR